MTSEWKDIFGLITNIRNRLLESCSLSSGKKLEFVDQFLLQLTVLWVLQKHRFFNNDKNYFNNMFQLIAQKSAGIAFNTINDFMDSFLTRLIALEDFQISQDSDFGRLRGCKSAIFIDLVSIKQKTDFPNDLYYLDSDKSHTSKTESLTAGIFSILDRFDNQITGAFLGSLYEKLISSEKKRQGGVYYSPVELTGYITRYSLRVYLMDQLGSMDYSMSDDISIIIKSLDKPGILRLYEKLKDISILDPAVGTGQFLESAADELLLVYSMVIKRFKELQEPMILNDNMDQSDNIIHSVDYTKVQDKAETQFYLLNFLIFPKSLFGIDIDPFVIPFTKARLFIYLAQYFKENMTHHSLILPFQCNLQIGDALLLNWKDAFKPMSTSHAFFSLILTNPPYIGESNNKDIFRTYSLAFPSYYEGKLDIWYLFFHLAINQVVPKGIVSFLTTNYWLTASGASKLRNRIYSETYILEFIDFGENRVFQGAHGIHSSVIIIKNLKAQNPTINCVSYTNKIPKGEHLLDHISNQLTFQIDQKDLTLDNWDKYFHFIPPDVSHILRKIIDNCSSLKDSTYSVKEGLITGLNRINKRQIQKYGYPSAWINRGIFIFNLTNENDYNTLETFTIEEKKYLKPIYKNSSIEPYSTRVQTHLRLLYLVKSNLDLSILPNIKKHLDHYHKALRNSLDHPPYLNRPRKPEIFLSPKLVTPQRSRTTRFAYNCTEWFATQDVYFICERGKSKRKLKILLLFLQSKVSFFWFSWMGKKKGSQLEFFGESISNFPIPKVVDNPNLLVRITEYLIFFYTLDKVPREFHHIWAYFEEKIASLITYTHFFTDLILSSKNKHQSYKDISDKLLQNLKEINIEKFLTFRYSIFASYDHESANKDENSDIIETYLKIIGESYNRISKDKQIMDFYNYVNTFSIVKQINNFYASKNHKK